MSYWDRIKNPACKLCSLHDVTARVCSVTGRGPVNARVMFVGEAPGEAEEKRGLPFVGRSGHLLSKLLDEVEFDANYTVVNAVCCRPPDNKTPTTTQWRTCSEHYLYPIIQKQKPSLIICLGLTGLKAVLNDSKLNIRDSRRKLRYLEIELRGKGRGTDTTIRKRKVPVLVTYHPAAILRDPTKWKIVCEDIRQAMRVLSGAKLEEEPSDRIYILQDEDEDIPWNLSAKHGMALDLETNKLSPFEADSKILACGVSQAPLHAHAFRIGDNLATERLKEALLKKTMKIGHNIKFDLLWLKKYGFKVQGPVFDTMVAFHMLDENYPDKRLAHLAMLFTPMGDYAGEIKENRLKEGYLEGLDDDTLLRYVCGDADAAYRLHLLFENRLRQEGLRGAYHLAMRTLRTLVDVEYNGVFVDHEALDIEAARTGKKLQKVKKWLHTQYPGVNFRSSIQVRKLLYKEFGIRPGRRTATGVPSTDEKALRKAHDRATDPIHQKTIRGILELRRLDKLLGTYINPLRDKHLKPDGLVHPSYNLASTVTQRLSCDSPNLQNLHPDLKRVFSSRWGDRGYIVQADFSQMELRVLAHYSQEERLLDAFYHERDIHLETASEVFGKKPSSITEQERYLAKTINFLIVYGGGAGRLASEANIPITLAEDFIERYNKRLPKVQRWIHQVRRECLRTGRVRSLFGTIRRLPIDDPNSEVGKRMLRQAVNFPIQETAAKITLLCGCDVHAILRHGMQSVLIGTVHDSLIGDSPEHEVDEYMLLTEEICTRPNTKQYGFELDVPLKVDISFGPNWKDQKELPNV